MKKFGLIIIIAIGMYGCGITTKKVSDQQAVNELEQLVEVEDYFKLKTAYTKNIDKLSEKHSIYYNAIINNVFNKAEQSNAQIDKLLTKESESLNDTMLNKIYHTKLLNHLNLYEYAKAAEASKFIQSYFSALNDSNDIANLENELKIWTALKDVPRQEIHKTADALIPMTRDKVGLFNIDVSFGDSTKNLLFDTGANFSVLVRSLAKQLGLEILEADFFVTAATGLKVQSDIAVAPELSIGGITFRNVFFLVLDDKDLSFPQLDYYINGAIGFPVIEAMDEIRVRNNNQIFIPKDPVEYSYNNFALNGLLPIIAAKYNGDTLRFNFDTGATRTSLYPKYYNEYKEEIESRYSKETFTSGSGGGFQKFDGYIINDFTLKIGDSEAQLDNVRLHINNIGGEESNFHGNFGQDYIKQFDEMILSFKYASVTFK